ncbi:penicillin-binding protein 2 [Nocardioides marmoriginsengisoli]|uniref:Penicillin-binding protein 2 n=2 Tax=Nocardioides marmoriginsengisoli TaxID=661483 RepID=A0A3N0CPT8_9ACTN|nr:penicillin-binding protein 2 [Nocardioides marmoriginsengisoli]
MRLRVGLIVIAMVLSVFGVRLVQLQGLDPKAYAARADAAGLVKLPLPATRGEITDRNGVPLAESVSGLMIFADPQRTRPNAEKIARILANRLELDYFDVLDALRKSNGAGKPDLRFAYVARRVPEATALAAVAAVKKAGFQGVDTRPDPVRFYPAKDVGANLLGFLGADGKPLAGLEMMFEKQLAGKDGSESYEVGGGNRIPLGENTEVKPVNGKDLTLTIDRDVQFYAQRVLRTTVQNSRAESGAAIAIDTKTGDILALADYPSYDANDAGAAPKADRGSRALSNVYEPGSVEKVLTTSALIDAGKVTPRTRIRVPANLPIGSDVINDYFEHSLIKLTLAGVIAKSSNIGTVLATRQFKPEQLWGYLDKFGLGHRAGIGLAGETRGLLPKPADWTELTQATISFGQGLSVNALQMATAINAVANGGELISPSLIKGRATTGSGVEVGSDVATRHRVISPQAASAAAKMMEMVVTQGAGTAPGAGIPGYRVAGKTGTAQQVGKTCKCYDGSLAVSFAGFAPADDPRFTVYVVIQKPKNGGSGGGTAGPVFRKVMSYLLQKYAVPPTNTPPAALPVEW